MEQLRILTGFVNSKIEYIFSDAEISNFFFQNLIRDDFLTSDGLPPTHLRGPLLFIFLLLNQKNFDFITTQACGKDFFTQLRVVKNKFASKNFFFEIWKKFFFLISILGGNFFTKKIFLIWVESLKIWAIKNLNCIRKLKN